MSKYSDNFYRKTKESLNSNKGYLDVFRVLSKYIVAGDITFGEKLPVERMMSEKLNINRITLQRAYKQLVSDGYAVHKKGYGYYVCYQPIAGRIQNDIYIPLPRNFKLQFFHELIISKILKEANRTYSFVNFDFPDCSKELKNCGLLYFYLGDLHQREEFEKYHHLLPITIIDNPLNLDLGDSIVLDNMGAISIGMDYLTSLGHEKIMFLIDQDCDSSHLRKESFMKPARLFGVESKVCVSSIDHFVEEIREMLRSPKRPSAVFAANPLICLTVLGIIYQEGLKIPEDISVLCCGNYGFLNYILPKVSYVDLNYEELAKQAIQNLIQHIQGHIEESGRQIIIPAVLQVEDSCRAVK